MNHRIVLLGVLVGSMPTTPTWAQPEDALLVEAEAVAQRDGIPAGPLQQKVREGRAKGVPAARIRRAVEHLRGQLVEGRTVCGPGATALCIAAAADAVAIGADRSAIAGLVRQADDGQEVRALVAVSTLASRGMRHDEAIRSVSQAMSAGRLEALVPALSPDARSARPALDSHRGLPNRDPTRDRTAVEPAERRAPVSTGVPHAPTPPSPRPMPVERPDDRDDDDRHDEDDDRDDDRDDRGDEDDD